MVFSDNQRDDRHPGWPTTLGPLHTPAGVVSVRPIRLRDGRQWSRIRLRDRDYLEKWEPVAPTSWDNRHTVLSWWDQWHMLRSAARRGRCLPFAITVDDSFAGQITLANITREPTSSAWLGYWVSSSIRGGGVATAAAAMVVDHALGPAGLHRVEATVRPENNASIQVLAKTGFRQEGLFRRYLNMPDGWQDHFCYAQTVEELGAGQVARLLASGHVSKPAGHDSA